MTIRTDTKVVDVLDPVTRLRRVRISREISSGQVMMQGKHFTSTTSQFLDGAGHRVGSTGDGGDVVTPMEWSAVPARTQDVMDLGRLSLATQTLAKQMSRFGPDNPPSAEQVTVWLQSWQGLQQWKKRADERLTHSEGEIQSVGKVLSQFV